MSKPMLKSLSDALKARGVKSLDRDSLAGELLDALEHFKHKCDQLSAAQTQIRKIEDLHTEEVKKRAKLEKEHAEDLRWAEMQRKQTESLYAKVKKKLDGERSRILQVMRVIEQVGNETIEETRCKLLMAIAEEHGISLSSDNDVLRDLVFIVEVLLLETAGRE